MLQTHSHWRMLKFEQRGMAAECGGNGRTKKAMKILYLAHRIPYPPNKGDKIRSFNEVKVLARHFTVDLVCLADQPGDIVHAPELEKICGRVKILPVQGLAAKIRGLAALMAGGTISVGYFYRDTVQQVVDSWLDEDSYQAIFCFSSTMAEYIFRSKTLATLPQKPRLIMDYCDLDSDKWVQYSKEDLFLGWLYRMEGARLSRYEKRINHAFDASVFVSNEEADLFRRSHSDATNIFIAGNGVDHDFFSPEIPVEPRGRKAAVNLIFTGAMDYHANVDGVSWFCNDILPQVRQHLPETHFMVVGSNPVSKVRRLTSDEVTITGFVEDVRPYYKSADIAVIPLRLARGVQNKLLEAMSMGKAVVTTSKAADPLNLIDGVHVLIADSPEEFAAAIRFLAERPDRRRELGDQAQKYIRERFDWGCNLDGLLALCLSGRENVCAG